MPVLSLLWLIEKEIGGRTSHVLHRHTALLHVNDTGIGDVNVCDVFDIVLVHFLTQSWQPSK